MGQNWVSFFQQSLANTGLTFLESGQDIPLHFVPYGKFILVDNLDFCTAICNSVAKDSQYFRTFIEFKKLQNNPLEKPVEPDKNDPIFQPRRGTKFDPSLVEKYGVKKIRLVVATNNYFQARQDYEKRRYRYQKQSVQIRHIRATYSFDEQGYLEYVLDTLKIQSGAFVPSFFFTPRTITISEEARKKHTFITGGTGSGKSETIKHIIRHYLTRNTEPALVVLDPHGDLAEDIARFRENATNNRLVYIRPQFFKGRDITFNPFEFADKDEVSLNRAQKQFLGALQQVLNEELTKPQRAILTPCLGVMLHQDGMTFKDLVRFMDDDKNTDLVKYGQKFLPNEQDRDFFKNQFYARNFETTKEALKYRFNEIIRDPIVRDFLCHESSFDFSACLEEGKLIVLHFDPQKQSKEAIRTIGQLVTAFLISYSICRKRNKRRPIHLFADECQYFVSPAISEIMGESRKFGLYATLATQRTEQVGKDLVDAIFGNVGCYLIGRNKSKTAEKMAKEHPLSADDIRGLKKLQFYQIDEDKPPIKSNISIIGKKYGLKGEKWRDLILQQGKLYYRSNRPPPEYDTPTTLNDLKPSKTIISGRQPKFNIPDVS